MQTMPKATRPTGPMTNDWGVCHDCKAAKQWHDKHPDGMRRAAFKRAHAPAPGIFPLVCATVVHKGHHRTGRLGNQNRPKRHAERPIRQHQTAQKPNRMAANRLREASTAKHKTGKQAWKYSPDTNRKTMETTVKQQHIVDDRATPTFRD